MWIIYRVRDDSVGCTIIVMQRFPCCSVPIQRQIVQCGKFITTPKIGGRKSASAADAAQPIISELFKFASNRHFAVSVGSKNWWEGERERGNWIRLISILPSIPLTRTDTLSRIYIAYVSILDANKIIDNNKPYVLSKLLGTMYKSGS